MHTSARAHVRAGACVCSRVCVCTFPNVCARGRAHVCACTCVRARCAGAKSRLWPSYSPASFGRPAQIPRAGKPRRSRNPHTEPILLRATTGGAAGESAAMACLPRIVELARVRLGVGSGVEAPSFERRRMLPNRAPLCCVHTSTRGHTPAGTSAPSASRCAGPTFVTGTGAVFCFRSSTGVSGIARSPRTTGVHPASTRMQTSAITRRRQRIRGLPSASPTPARQRIRGLPSAPQLRQAATWPVLFWTVRCLT